MIESDGMTYEMWKTGKSILKYLFLVWLIIMPIIIVILGDFSWSFIKAYLIVSVLYLLIRFMRKNINSKLYFAKMNNEFINLKRDGEDSIDFSWNEISSLSRLRFTNPALYILTVEKQKDKEYIFPTSSNLLTFSMSLNGFGIQRDFSKMGKHIRKMKKEKNLNSFYASYFKRIFKKIKTFANTVQN